MSSCRLVSDWDDQYLISDTVSPAVATSPLESTTTVPVSEPSFDSDPPASDVPTPKPQIMN